MIKASVVKKIVGDNNLRMTSSAIRALEEVVEKIVRKSINIAVEKGETSLKSVHIFKIVGERKGINNVDDK